MYHDFIGREIEDLEGDQMQQDRQANEPAYDLFLYAADADGVPCHPTATTTTAEYHDPENLYHVAHLFSEHDNAVSVRLIRMPLATGRHETLHVYRESDTDTGLQRLHGEPQPCQVRRTFGRTCGAWAEWSYESTIMCGGHLHALAFPQETERHEQLVSFWLFLTRLRNRLLRPWLARRAEKRLRAAGINDEYCWSHDEEGHTGGWDCSHPDCRNA